MFTDEIKIDFGSYSNDFIRLSPKTLEKLKKGKEETYNLINRPLKKFEKSITVGEGISYHGMTKLIILDGTLKEFSWSRTTFL